MMLSYLLLKIRYTSVWNQKFCPTYSFKLIQKYYAIFITLMRQFDQIFSHFSISYNVQYFIYFLPFRLYLVRLT